jgi:photosystem II stability/assembly factor-like uncharacterized protein
MSTPFRKFLPSLVAAFAVALTVRAAEPAYDMYLCANVSAQGQVIGSRAGAYQSGIYRSTDRQQFEHIGPNHIRIYTLTSDPSTPYGLFVGALDGVLRTLDRGTSWRVMTSWDMTEPHSVVFDPHAPDDIYISLPDGIGVSHDHGQTWKRSNAGIKRTFTQILAVDRTKAGRVLAGTELGIYLTEDGAKTWKLVQATGKTTYDLRQSPHDPKVFLAVTSMNGAFRSEDSGRTWKPIAGIPATHTLHNLDFDRSDAKRLVVAGWGLGVQVSEDAGRTWIDRSAGLPNKEIWRVSADPARPGRLYAAPHLSPVQVSDDFGQTWKPLVFDKAIIYDIVFVPRH